MAGDTATALAVGQQSLAAAEKTLLRLCAKITLTLVKAVEDPRPVSPMERLGRRVLDSPAAEVVGQLGQSE